MMEFSQSQKARHAISTFKTLADSLPLKGVYHPSGKTGGRLADALIQLSPEIYGSMTSDRIAELKGLQYVIDRMPRGIERATRIIFTGQEDFESTTFEKILPLRRRRISYAVSPTEFCFVLTTGTSEVYDILTHLTFLNIEAEKIARQADNFPDGISAEWRELTRIVKAEEEPEKEALQQALWNLAIILGRTWRETRDTWEYLDKSRREHRSNNGLFNIIYGIGNRVLQEHRKDQDMLTVYFTPNLDEMLNHQKYAAIWSDNLKHILIENNLEKRPLHVISSNTHSIRNLLYGAGALGEVGLKIPADVYQMAKTLREDGEIIEKYAVKHGFFPIPDTSGSAITVQIIDMCRVDFDVLHPSLNLSKDLVEREQPVLLVIDYAFGTQAFDLMDELLQPVSEEEEAVKLLFASISIMGKAGILPGDKGDVMLPSSYVLEGVGHSYMVKNGLVRGDFPDDVNVYEGPMLTVLGTSLQNRAVLERFHSSDWSVVGLEMEGAHYCRAISASIIKGHIPADIKVCYAYYASDNPIVSGETLASGPMGEEGVVPTYLISRLILEKILND
ncbi:hypothetical protein JWG39_08475 [Desulforhopalus vacuolatus]|uniref:DUF6909 family protein n=1 Tax=Desulforhopalus vacuolatus TaxID=40414 RepID=UPI0019643E46|nr:hypothetical protein [Desulforhopalus vacuolatus]MBM9519850.1 hypothetical protein [Desulforhopalus vacuolatus]